jgi:hypothetical protein
MNHGMITLNNMLAGLFPWLLEGEASESVMDVLGILNLGTTPPRRVGEFD